MYLKNVHTGVVKTLEEWKDSEIKYWTKHFNENKNELIEDYGSLENYLKSLEEGGTFYDDLKECDKDGNLLDHDGNIIEG